MAKKNPTEDAPAVPDAILTLKQRDQVREMIADAAGKAEHHARASVTSNELQMFAAMAMQGMLANRTNVGMTPEKIARMAMLHAVELANALMPEMEDDSE